MISYDRNTYENLQCFEKSKTQRIEPYKIINYFYFYSLLKNLAMKSIIGYIS